MTSVDSLLDRNRSFAEEGFRDGLTIAPTGRLLLVGCVDPRVDPAEVLGLEPGEAVVIRNVGGRVTPATIKTIAMLGRVSAARGGGAPGVGWNLVVLQHTDCGTNDLTAHPDLLADYFGVPLGDVDAKAVGDPDRSVRVDVDVLRASPLPAAFTVSGLVYDVATGRVRTVVEPAPLREE